MITNLASINVRVGQLVQPGTARHATIVHRDFECAVDEKNGRIAASFEAVLTDANGDVTRLYNMNFWRVRGDKFQEVYVYMSGANVLV